MPQWIQRIRWSGSRRAPSASVTAGHSRTAWRGCSLFSWYWWPPTWPLRAETHHPRVSFCYLDRCCSAWNFAPARRECTSTNLHSLQISHLYSILVKNFEFPWKLLYYLILLLPFCRYLQRTHCSVVQVLLTFLFYPVNLLRFVLTDCFVEDLENSLGLNVYRLRHYYNQAFLFI